MNISDNTIIKTSDAQDFYIIEDLFYLPIDINLNEAISRGAKFIKVVALPSMLKEDYVGNSNILPVNIFSDNSQDLSSTENSEQLDHQVFGQNSTPLIIKKFFSKNTLKSGQSKFNDSNRQAIFPKKDIFTSIIDNKIGYFLKKINFSRNIQSVDNGVSTELKHFFIVYILDKKERIIESKKIFSDKSIEDYTIEAENDEIYEVSNQLLVNFVNSISLTYKTFEFNRGRLIQGSGLEIDYYADEIFGFFNTLDLNQEIILFFSYLGTSFELNNIGLEPNDSTNLSLSNKFSRNQDAISFLTTLWTNIVDQNLDSKEIDILATVSLGSNLNISYSRPINILKEDIRKIYNGYEIFNKRTILAENFNNKIIIEKIVEENRSPFYKFTFNKIEESFLNYTTLLENLTLKIRIEYQSVQPNIYVDKLFLDSSFNDSDNVLLSVGDAFQINSLFFNSFTNIFYCNDFSGDGSEERFEIYIGGVNIPISSSTNENNTSTSGGFSIVNDINLSRRNFQLQGLNQRLVYNRPVVAINNLMNYLEIQESESNFLNNNVSLQENFFNIQNEIENINANNLDEKSIKSKILNNTLFEIKTRYSNNQGESYEVKRYNTGTRFFNLNKLNYNFSDNNINPNVSQKSVEIKAIVFDDNVIENLNNDAAEESIKESFCNTLYSLDDKKFNSIINNVENYFFKSSNSKQDIYEKIFGIFNNSKRLPYAYCFKTKNNNLNPDIVNPQEEITEENQETSNIYTDIRNRKVTSLFREKRIKVSNIVIDRIVDYKNSNIKRSEVDFNSTFEIKTVSSENSNAIINYKKAFKNKKYNLMLDIKDYKEIFNSNKNFVEVYHHLNLCYFNKGINDFKKENIDNKNFCVIDENFLIDSKSFYVNDNFKILKEKNKLLISGINNKTANFNKEYYDKCISLWSKNKQLDPNLFLDFLLERYVIKIKSLDSQSVKYLMISNLVDITKSFSENFRLNNKAQNNNLKINLLSSKFIKPNIQVLYN